MTRQKRIARGRKSPGSVVHNVRQEINACPELSLVFGEGQLRSVGTSMAEAVSGMEFLLRKWEQLRREQGKFR